MLAIEKMLCLWNRIVDREPQVFHRADILFADELIQTLRKETALHKGTELKPCTKFLKNTPFQQMVAIGREFQEVHYAFLGMQEAVSKPVTGSYESYKNQLSEELVDLQTACQTLLVMLGVDIDKVRHDVIVKNAARGYYNHY